jgi:hypothetical protein
LGICLDDFLDISPTEFMAIHDKWLEREKLREQNEWVRARWQVFKTLCPPDKKQINVFDIEIFAWEKETIQEVPVSNRELFDKAIKKYGKRLQTGHRDSSKRKKL